MVIRNIKLHAFPSLAREVIFKQMDGLSIFDLLQLSKKVKRMFKSDCRSYNQKIAIVFGENISVSFVSQANEEIGKIEILSETELSDFDVGYPQRIGETLEVYSVRGETSLPTLKTFWKDTWMGLQSVCKELIHTFQTPTFHIKIDLDEYKEGYEPIISWINGVAGLVGDVQFSGFRVESSILTWCLENLKTTTSITVSTFLGQYFMPTVIHVNTHKLMISDGKWVTLNHLKSLECAEVKIKKVSMSDATMSQFLQYLKRGSNPNLKLLSLEVERNVAIEVILSELNAVKRQKGEWTFLLSTGHKSSFTCHTEANAYPYGDPDTRIEINIERK
ncbi:unnamed protein product [Caenorhabditis brenneri]